MHDITNLSIQAHIFWSMLRVQATERADMTSEAGEVSSYMILMAAIVAAAVVVAPQVAGVITTKGAEVVTSAG